MLINLCSFRFHGCEVWDHTIVALCILAAKLLSMFLEEVSSPIPQKYHVCF